MSGLLSAEHILDGSWATAEQPLTNEAVASRFDGWYRTLQELSRQGVLSAEEQQCLDQFLQVLGNLRHGLILCYERPKFPRTNNDMEGYIRTIKTRYRRISGRKNWNAYLVRYGSRVAYVRRIGAYEIPAECRQGWEQDDLEDNN